MTANPKLMRPSICREFKNIDFNSLGKISVTLISGFYFSIKPTAHMHFMFLKNFTYTV